jgi:hypothetical protein
MPNRLHRKSLNDRHGHEATKIDSGCESPRTFRRTKGNSRHGVKQESLPDLKQSIDSKDANMRFSFVLKSCDIVTGCFVKMQENPFQRFPAPAVGDICLQIGNNCFGQTVGIIFCIFRSCYETLGSLDIQNYIVHALFRAYLFPGSCWNFFVFGETC